MPKTENRAHESGVANAQHVRRRRLRTKVLSVFSKVRTVFSKVLTEISIVLTVFRQLPGGEKDRPAGSRLPAFRQWKRSTGATVIATSARQRRDGTRAARTPGEVCRRTAGPSRRTGKRSRSMPVQTLQKGAHPRRRHVTDDLHRAVDRHLNLLRERLHGH